MGLSFRGCIFDLDGVIVDTAGHHFHAWEKLTTELGFKFTEDDNEALKGISRVDSLKAILEIGKVKLGETEFNEALIKKNNYYLESIEQLDTTDILPGVEQFFQLLKNAGIKICLGSASKNGKPVLERLAITHYFDAMVDGNDVRNSKPHPEVFTKGSKLISLSPSEVIVFEDAYKGIEAAIGAGCYPVGIGKAENLSNAQFVIPGFTNLTLENLQSLINLHQAKNIE